MTDCAFERSSHTVNKLVAASTVESARGMRLSESEVARGRGWRPLFGTDSTTGSASRLRREGARSGDVFRFHGWFRQTEYAHGQMSALRLPDIVRGDLAQNWYAGLSDSRRE